MAEGADATAGAAGAAGFRGGDAWHWQERDLKGYVDSRVAELFPAGRRVPLRGGAGGGGGPGAICAFLGGPGEARGEAFGNVRRGRSFAILSLEFAVPFSASIQGSPDEEDVERSGKVTVGNVEDSNSAEEWDVSVELASSSSAAARGGGARASEGAIESRLKAIVRDQCLEAITPRVQALRAELQRLAAGEAPEEVRSGNSALQQEEARTAAAEQRAVEEERGRAEARQQALPQRYRDALESLRGPGAAELEAVSVSSCDLTDGELSELHSLLAAAPGLRSLDLSGNRLTNGALQPLAAALAAGTAPRLERLDLRGNKLCPPAGTILGGLKVLRKGLKIEWE